MTASDANPFVLTVLGLWSLALFLSFHKNKKPRFLLIFSLAGTLVLGALLTTTWIRLERPPLRTLGETRTLYAFFLAGISVLVKLRWKNTWLARLGLIFAALFLSQNLLHPDFYNKSLMPALQSPWFVPHVVVYLFAYAILGASFLLAISGIFVASDNKMRELDSLTTFGFSFLTLGQIFGAFWAKEAWGHYWTWDPKETWAFLTWLAFLAYLHWRHAHPERKRSARYFIVAGFFLLMICWFGVQYMPSTGVHTYSAQP